MTRASRMGTRDRPAEVGTAEERRNGAVLRAEHVRPLVESVRRKSDAPVVCVRAKGEWNGGSSIEAAGEVWPVVFCPSELAIREALLQHERTSPDGVMLLLTPLSDAGLSWDVRTRLARRRILEPEPWEILKDHFRARSPDPRLAREPWIAEALLEHMPAGGYPPAQGSVLDVETAWRHLFAALLGLHSTRPDAVAILRWSLDPTAGAAFETLPNAALPSLRARLEETAGPLGAALVAVMEAGHTDRLVAIGVICEVLQPESGAGPELARAAGRLEAQLGMPSLERELTRHWFDAAAEVTADLPATIAVRVHQQAEELLREIRADAFVELSSVLPGGLNARLEKFAGAIRAFVAGGPAEQVERVYDLVTAHRELARSPEKRERLEMMLRLVRFVAARRNGGDSAAGASFAARARLYAEDSSFADWARARLLGGEAEEALAAAVSALLDAVKEAREAENRRFAEALADFNRLPAGEGGIVPVEQILEQVAAKVAATGPVLVLVIDGADFVVFRQLADALRERGWEQWLPAGRYSATVGVAVLPSVTAYSRSSLFAGRVVAGAAERRAFAEHPALARVSHDRRPPALFLKGDLVMEDGSGLTEKVRRALGDAQQKVVGIVLNAVDDYLAKSDQVRPRWSPDQIKPLLPILHEASMAGRAVVLVSDHGHVLEAGTEPLAGNDEDRWRPYSEPVADTEQVFEGPRIQAATGMAKIIAPWSEAVRYTRRKAGYHGGATPQEVLVPVAVLAPWDRGPEGWSAFQESVPVWWGEAEPAPPSESASSSQALKPRRRKAAAAQASLFGDTPTTGEAAVQGDVPRPWISALLQAPIFESQRSRAGRIAPPDEDVRSVLDVLERYQGRAPRAAVARALGKPEIRLRGILAGLQRLLNVDGYPVLSVDEATGAVELHKQLLLKQFQLEV